MQHRTIGLLAAVAVLAAAPALAADTGQPAGGATTAPTIGTGNPTANQGTARGLSGSSKSLDENRARQILQQQGFSDVTNLKEESDGTWMGKARKGGAELNVDINQNGVVTTR
jgi:opacity protein-like surface antigen